MEQDLKKTAKTYETVSEEKVLEEAKDSEKATEKMVEKEEQKEEVKTKEERETLLKAKEEKDRRGKRTPYKRKTPEEERAEIIASWEPKTKLGREVKDGKIKNIDEILDNDQRILESELVDYLLHIKTDLIAMGQAKGKFGGGKRRAWRQTQKKRKEGNVLTFSALAIVGDENGHVGLGLGKAKETLPARDKAIRKAKLNMMKVTRDCAGFDCSCSELHSIPFKITGKAGSVKITLIPAPQGTGLVVANELKKVLKLAGIKDVYSKTFGSKRTTFNLIKACIDALKKTNQGVKK